MYIFKIKACENCGSTKAQHYIGIDTPQCKKCGRLVPWDNVEKIIDHYP